MKLVLISDTHQRHKYLRMPKGDVLVHAGDFCSHGNYEEVKRFGDWLRTLDYHHILFIAGNHDKTFEFDLEKSLKLIPEETITGGKIHYLQDGYIVLQGVKFYGSPWQPRFYNWAFNLTRGGSALRKKWKRIPNDTDVLITHCPPHGILDKTDFKNENIGCKMLFDRVTDIKPRLHVFGHCHAGYGMNYHLLAGTDFINAAIVNDWHYITNLPVEYEEDFDGNELRRNEPGPEGTPESTEGAGKKGDGFIGEGI
ncbi:MAG: metallophosphoesterase [Desulfobacterales bacterium]|nr:metallophosphoesterase [Desulfobacterales bacterium]